jgi:uridine kinase
MQRQGVQTERDPVPTCCARVGLMRGDSIVVEAHHVKAATGVVGLVLPLIEAHPGKYTISIAGESGSGKSETATALAEALEAAGKTCVVLQQDDYFVYPPKSNDRTRRADINWVGPQEVHLGLLSDHLKAFKEAAPVIEKPLVIYEEDRVTSERLDVADADVAIAEGTYTTLLSNVDTRVFIDRDYMQTRAHRAKRRRNEAELDPFIDEVLAIEHRIISAHKTLAQLVVDTEYSVASHSTRG